MSRLTWALGLVPLAVLAAAAVVIETPKVETKVRAAAAAAVETARPNVSVEGRDVSLAVAGLDAAGLERLRAAAAGAAGVRLVNERIEQLPPPPSPALAAAPAPVTAAPAPPPPEVPAPASPPALPSPVEPPAPSAAPAPPAAAPQAAEAPPASNEAPPALIVANPFSLVVERTGSGLSVSGFAPSAEDRQALTEAIRSAAAPGSMTADLTLASGLPPNVDFQTAARFVAVQATRLVSGRAGMSGDVFSISGVTPDEGGLAALRAASSGVLPGGLKLGSLDVRAAPPPPPPRMQPYVFEALREGDRLILTGAAPSAEARAKLLEAARLTGLQVVDRLTLASGEPAGFGDIAALGLAQAARLEQGRFSLTDAAYSLRGAASDFATLDAVQAALRTLPAAALDIAPPVVSPFAFSILRDGQAVILRGVMPDEATRAQALAALRAAFPRLEVRDETRIARGAPPAFGALLQAAFDAASKLTSGSVSFTGDRLKLSGVSGATLASIVQALGGAAPPGFAFDLADLQAAPAPPPPPPPPPPPAPAPTAAPAPAAMAPPEPARAISCAPDSSGVIARANILFNSGSASPLGDSSSEISRIADLLRACGEARARIAGHTDGVGDRAPNLRLSRQRARNVARELVRAGAPPARVATTFYAWDAPAASPEVTAQDRSRNRRVEVIVRQGSM